MPVLVSVAAIFRQMMPDLPMPVRMTRPRQSMQQLDGAIESVVEPRHQREDRRGFGFEHLPRERRDQPWVTPGGTSRLPRA